MDIIAPVKQSVKQYNKLREQTNPNIEELENFIKAAENFRFCNKDSQNINALRLKYQAMTTVPTTIEKTMLPYQLYAVNNPLWAVGLSALKIETFLDLERNTGRLLSKAVFNVAYNYETNNVFIDTEAYDPPTIQFHY